MSRWAGLLLVVGCGSPVSPHTGSDAAPMPPDATPDAPPDARPDAPPDAGAAFHVTSPSFPVHRSLYDPTRVINVYATNDTAAQLGFTVNVTGPFVVDTNGCTAADPGVL